MNQDDYAKKGIPVSCRFHKFTLFSDKTELKNMKISIASILFLIAISISGGCGKDTATVKSDSIKADSAVQAEKILSYKGSKSKTLLSEPVIRNEHARPGEGDVWPQGELCGKLQAILSSREGGYDSIANPGSREGLRTPKEEFALGGKEGVINPKFGEYHLFFLSAEEPLALGTFQDWALKLTNCMPESMKGLVYEELADGYYSSIYKYVLFERKDTAGRIRLGLGRSGQAYVVEITFGK